MHRADADDLVPPWLQGPYELLEHALEMVERSDTDKNRRIALLAIDNAVEITIKTFLALSEVRGGMAMGRGEVKKLNFYALFETLRERSSNHLEGLDDERIRYYHEQRNDLYHSETGQTARRADVDQYAVIARTLFAALFGLPSPDVRQARSGPDQALVRSEHFAEREQELLTRLRLEEMRRQEDGSLTSSAWEDFAQRLSTDRWGPSPSEGLLVQEVENFLKTEAQAEPKSAWGEGREHLRHGLLVEFLLFERSLLELRDRLEGEVSRISVGVASHARLLSPPLPADAMSEIGELAAVRNALAHGGTPDSSHETLARVRRVRDIVESVRLSLTEKEVWAWRQQHGLPQPGDADSV